MKTKLIITALSLSIASFAFGQNPALELTFTAIDSATYIQVDSIKIMNRTQGGDTVLYWPDTILVLDYQTGIPHVNNKKKEFQVFQNYPNPVKDHTAITMYIPEKDRVGIMILDILGRNVISTEKMLDRGYHSFSFTPGGGKMFIFTAYWQGFNSSIKVLHGSHMNGRLSSLVYLGDGEVKPQFKSESNKGGFVFNPGDELLYIGYTNSLQSGMLDIPETSATHTFQFAYKIPCPGIPTITYEGQEYNTVQIFSQCWLKENLNVGTMIPGTQNMTDNGVIEKYCYDNLETNCDEWGGLYQWDEIMQYSGTPAIQGICPPDWHIPTDEEWKVLEGAIDGQYGIGDPEWDWWDMRGSDIGYRIKLQNGWIYNMNGSDSHGFALLPGGYRYFNNGNFHHSGIHANLWSSSEHTGEYKWFRFVIGYIIEIYRNSTPWENGMSVRCIKN